jgi:hypothetical protein
VQELAPTNASEVQLLQFHVKGFPSRVGGRREEDVVNVRLNGERVVLLYGVPNKEFKPSGSIYMIVHDADISSDYVVLWRAGSNTTLADNEYELLWKGNLDFCLSKFTNEVADFEHDAVLEHNKS